jgi:transcriptional regulator with XRE-family HTH domain
MAKLTPEACRAARALLRWGVRDLAAAAGVGVVTVARFEGGEEILEATLDKLHAAFEANCVEITNGKGTGARLLKRIT